MDVEKTSLPGVLLLQAKKFGDHRGFFSETFRSDALTDAGVTHGWVQDNHSMSSRTGVVRGLHYQTGAEAQAKLVRVIRGAILDVVVDIREGSPTYGKHVAVEISETKWNQIYVPTGFAHGFCTLSDHCEVIYKVSAYYSPAAEGGLLWCDPDLGIDWPITPDQATVSDRDRVWPGIGRLVSPFRWEP